MDLWRELLLTSYLEPSTYWQHRNRYIFIELHKIEMKIELTIMKIDYKAEGMSLGFVKAERMWRAPQFNAESWRRSSQGRLRAAGTAEGSPTNKGQSRVKLLSPDTSWPMSKQTCLSETSATSRRLSRGRVTHSLQCQKYLSPD